MAIKTSFGSVSDGDQLNEGYFNESLKHGIVSNTGTPVNFTPTDATTKILIIAKGYAESGGAASSLAGAITMDSDQDGQLDTTSIQVGDSGSTTTWRVPFTLLYIGTLSAATHSISVSESAGGIDSLEQIDIVAIEFLG